MAFSYVEAVRSLQPHGPYAIGGYSMGGIVAFEMARQLMARGESVRLLAILNQSTQDLHTHILRGPVRLRRARTASVPMSCGPI
jgi:thioesterase domain-containing protein